MEINNMDMHYLELLSDKYKTINQAAAEIINLTAIANLPKGTEYFLSDIHGEYEAFNHILRNASGTIKRRIDETFPDVPEKERKILATIIYYPQEKLGLLRQEGKLTPEFYKLYLDRIVTVLQMVSFKYTRSYVRKHRPKNYGYIIDELLYSQMGEYKSFSYRDDIINAIIASGEADAVIKEIADLITSLSIYKLHILGDIYDRGPGGDIVLDSLMKCHDVDITWGNHDIVWMGAAAGSAACVCNVIRICARYDNLHTLEVGYGISLRPLVTFAMKTYANDACDDFKTKIGSADAMYETEIESLRRIGKAISIMQFKLEGQVIDRHPHYEMDGAKLLDKIDFEKKTVVVDGKEYPMTDCNFPTIDPKDPYKLSAEEEAVMDRLVHAFRESAILKEHVRFLFAKGSIYKTLDGNLLFHGSMPLTAEGEFDYINTEDGPMRGKAWFDYADKLVRKGFFGKKGSPEKQRGEDFMWYLWCGYKSPLFGKKKMTTFERLFIEDESTWKEEKNPYYKLMDQPEICDKILNEFGCSGIIINGHMPVKKGSNPIHAGGKAIVIDGGFSKPYQKTTGIAGYSLVHNSYGFILSAHQAFESKAVAVREETDILSSQVARDNVQERMLNKDTDIGKVIDTKIEGLKMLIEAYRTGLISLKE